MTSRHIGVLGGTFDPVHLGHLRTAVELLEVLQLDKLLLIPAGVPPHRGAPAATARQRVAMLQLAVRGEARIEVDERECLSAETSYSVDTLSQLRREVGDAAALSFCVGTDAFLSMHQWHRWRELPELVHLIIMSRPGWQIPQSLDALECWRQRFMWLEDRVAWDEGDPRTASVVNQLRHESCGRIVWPSLTPVDISATRIRRRVAMGQSARFLVPDSVWRYIQRNGLYQLRCHDNRSYNTARVQALTGEQ